MAITNTWADVFSDPFSGEITSQVKNSTWNDHQLSFRSTNGSIQFSYLMAKRTTVCGEWVAASLLSSKRQKPRENSVLLLCYDIKTQKCMQDLERIYVFQGFNFFLTNIVWICLKIYPFNEWKIMEQNRTVYKISLRSRVKVCWLLNLHTHYLSVTVRLPPTWLATPIRIIR